MSASDCLSHIRNVPVSVGVTSLPEDTIVA